MVALEVSISITRFFKNTMGYLNSYYGASLTFSVNSRGHGGTFETAFKGEYFVVISLPISP